MVKKETKQNLYTKKKHKEKQNICIIMTVSRHKNEKKKKQQRYDCIMYIVIKISLRKGKMKYFFIHKEKYVHV